MSILRVKDNQGNLITIPLLKGDKGDKGDQGIQGIPGTPGTNGVNGKDLPVGSIIHVASSVAPTGFLVCNGDAVSRSTYPDLFTAIGTTYGAGDGSTTFNLPNLIGKVAWGSNTVGNVLEAGLPNIEGTVSTTYWMVVGGTNASEALSVNQDNNHYSPSGSKKETNGVSLLSFDASRSNSIYGNSDTVQPPALTLLPCIKVFNTAVNEGTIDVTSFANDVTDVVNRRYIVERSGTSDGTWQWTIWSDGWIEQLGWFDNGSNVRSLTHQFVLPFEMEYSTYNAWISSRRDGSGTQSMCCGMSSMTTLGVWGGHYGFGSGDLAQHLHLRVEGWMKR